MSTQKPQEPRRLHFIQKEEPFVAYGKPLNWKAGWAAVLFAIAAVLFVAAYAVGGFAVWLAVAFAVLAALFWLLLILPQPFDGLRRSALTMIHRYASHWWHGRGGRNRYESLEVEIGDVFGIRDFQSRVPRAIPNIGEIKYKPLYAEDGTILSQAYDPRYKTDSTTIWTSGESYFGLDEAEQEDRLASFARFLDAMSRSGNLVDSYVWQDQTLLGEYHRPDEQIVPGGDPALAPLQEEYLEQTREMDADSVEHHTTMTIALSRKKTGQIVKAEGGDYGKVLENALHSFLNLLSGGSRAQGSIGERKSGPLTHNDRIIEHRLKVDPVHAQWLHQQWVRPLDSEYLLSSKLAWPIYVDFDPWDHCIVGETYHVGLFIDDFPAGGMPPAAFWEILKVRVPKTVTVVFKISSSKVARRVTKMKTSTRHGSNLDLIKSRRRVTEEDRVAFERTLRKERELAEHRGQYGRVRVYVDVTGASLAEARANARAIRDAASEAPFELEPLIARQYEGISSLMPVGRGLSTLNLFR